MMTEQQAEHAATAETAHQDPLIRVDALRKEFRVRGRGRGARSLVAVDDVTLDIEEGETLAVVGESGSGKSTLGRAILQLERPTSGSVHYRGEDLTAMSPARRRLRQRDMQIIFQDPYSSLNPTRSALQQVLEPLQVLRAPDAVERAIEALERVGIPADAAARLPRSFSGGQRQRIAIARAIAVRPSFIVCDEPVSALDRSTQAQVADLLRDLQRQLGLTYLFISHDLSVVREIARRTAVMYRGRVVELGPTAQIFDSPQHPYTRRLLEAMLVREPEIARERLARVGADEADTITTIGDLREIAPGHLVRLSAPPSDAA
ncbi:ABC-type oligopeptide transport system ATPase subunit [Microbacterium resistens]|uniref:ABC-type oligopeptide transport system ATPase subunit n=1 Tax=Microbacterium resistens TaxID=156977 RepID=A0ABU1SFI6_9MICO|nr:ATP-binding cassette domain-containing protein [Microbacterium resistens]MDR6868377.1 ABC-type oligopeptide transport system ATPase subunit [Microbacterium resistens]